MRVAIIGSSCSGKTTLAKTLSDTFAVRHIELDDLFWQPNWKITKQEKFVQDVLEATQASKWIVSGNYQIVRETIYQRCTDIIWLDFPLSLLVYRGVRRTLKRIYSHEKICHGNIETWKHGLFSRKSIIMWILRTHGKLRQQISLEQLKYHHKHWVKLRSTSEITRWVNLVSQ